MVPRFKGIKNYENIVSNDDWRDISDDDITGAPHLVSSKLTNDNEKRLKSLNDNLNREKQNKAMIKDALSNKRLNKRIVFDSDIEDNCEQSVTNTVTTKKRKHEKKQLFENDSSDSDDQNIGFNARQEVLNLNTEKAGKLIEFQSRFAHDNRFRIDHRFVDDFGANNNDNELINETEKNLHLLGEVLGKSQFDTTVQNNNSKVNANTSSNKESKLFVTRFDPSNEKSAIYEIKKSKPSNKAKNAQQTEEIVETNTKEPEVSKEVYYEISSTLKDSLATNDEPFSLTKMFGSQNDNNKTDDSNNSDNDNEIINSQTKHAKLNKSLISLTNNPFKYDSSDTEDDNNDNDEYDDNDNEYDSTQNQISNDSVRTFRTNQKFFFEENDIRFYCDIFDSEELIERAKANGKERQQLMIKAMRIRKRAAKKNAKAKQRDRDKQLRGQTNYVKNNYNRHH